MGEVREAVRQRYAVVARQLAVGGGCCGGPSQQGGGGRGCGSPYRAEDLTELGLDGGLSLGCGNPVQLAELKPGETVLDLGSGGGLDVLLAAQQVGPEGHVYGVDMTDEMLELANRNRDRAGVTNATFFKGTIEQVPLPDGAVDVVISNCVINLAEDKAAVIQEAFRVLKPGGRLAVSDMVELQPLPETVKHELDAHVGCIAGTIPVDAYRRILVEAGFEAPEIRVTGMEAVFGGSGAVGSAAVWARKPVD